MGSISFRFEWSLKISEIARELDLERPPLYRKFEQLLRRLRDAMLKNGLGSWVLDEFGDPDESGLSLFQGTAAEIFPEVHSPSTSKTN